MRVYFTAYESQVYIHFLAESTQIMVLRKSYAAELYQSLAEFKSSVLQLQDFLHCLFSFKM